MLSAFKGYINDNFGSKRGLFNSFKYKVLTLLGCYRQYQNIDFSQVKRIVFICSGNICRSPLAEYVAKAQGVDAESYGLHCRGGDPADPRAVAYAASVGIDMSEHITRNIKDYTAREGDFLIGMEPHHITELESGEIISQYMSMLPLWGRRKNVYLHDPFNSNQNFFNKCEEILVESVSMLVGVMGKPDI